MKRALMAAAVILAIGAGGYCSRGAPERLPRCVQAARERPATPGAAVAEVRADRAGARVAAASASQ